MARLIDADVLLKAIVNYPYGYRGMIESEIENQPTVDAVEVIRCKDCKFSSPNGVYGCMITSSDYGLDERMYSDDFCSCGERKEE